MWGERRELQQRYLDAAKAAGRRETEEDEELARYMALALPNELLRREVFCLENRTAAVTKTGYAIRVITGGKADETA